MLYELSIELYTTATRRPRDAGLPPPAGAPHWATTNGFTDNRVSEGVPEHWVGGLTLNT